MATQSTNKKTSHRRNSDDSHSITRDSIISTAFDLFREKGYAKASISELARRVDMDPSSVYYYFPSKEALLAEISEPAISVPTLEELSSYTDSRTVQLYALIMMDVVQKCELPLDFIDVESAARKKPARFGSFYDRYKTFYHTLLAVIEKGIEEGDFANAPPTSVPLPSYPLMRASSIIFMLKNVVNSCSLTLAIPHIIIPLKILGT